jgi:hypothetical protein
MKGSLFFLFWFSSLFVAGQTRDEMAVLANTRSLQMTVFGSKDSTVLDGLFAKQLTYGHSGGKLEARKEALMNIIYNTSTYADLVVGPINVLMSEKTAIARHTMTVNETKEGKTNPLKLHIMLVWVKEKGSWKLMGRQAVKVQ